MPLATRRASPARRMSWWLGSSASAATRFCVLNILCDMRIGGTSWKICGQTKTPTPGKRARARTRGTTFSDQHENGEYAGPLCPHAIMESRDGMRRPVITVGFRDGSPPPREGDGFAVACVAGLSPCRRLSAHAARGYWFPRSVICSCRRSVYDVGYQAVKDSFRAIIVFAASVIALAGRTVLAHDVAVGR